MLALGFLHPWFLLGLGAVAVPIVIHLIHRRRARLVPFPTLRFLRLVEKRIARRRRLEELLVLLARALALALLALALAAPVARTPGGGRLDVARALVIDNSLSMGLAAPGRPSLLEQAKAAAAALLEGLSARDTAGVFPLHPARGEAGLSRDIAGVGTAVAAVAPTFGDTPLEEGVRRALAALEAAAEPVKDLVLLTDLQAGAVARLKASRLLEELPEGTRVFAVAPPARAAANLAVTAVTVQPLATAPRGHRVVVSVANLGGLEAGAVLALEAGGAMAARQEIRLAPGGAAELPFDLPETGESELPGAARLSGDELPGDDARWFVLPARRPVRILVVAEGPGQVARLDPVFFLLRALNPGPGAALAPEAADPSNAVSRDLNDYGAVVLADPGELPAELRLALGRYLERGGGMLVFAGPGAEPGPLGGGEGLAGLTLGEAAAGAQAEPGWLSLTDLDRRHPALAPLFVTSPPVDLALPRIYRHRRLGGLPAGTRVLARLTGGEPALVEARAGAGRLVLFCSTANPEWNDLALRVSFVPLLHSLLHDLAGREAPGGEEWRPERALSLSWPAGEESPVAVEVRLHEELRRVEPEAARGGTEARLGSFARPGVAALALVGRQGRQVRLVALNPDPAEGELGQGEWQGLAGRRVALAGPEPAVRAVAEGVAGLSLGEPLAAAVLLLLILEGWLAARAAFGQKARP